MSSMRSALPCLRALSLSLAVLCTSGCERALFSVINRGLEPPTATVAYEAEHGLALDIYRPASISSRPVPVLVFFYGGGWQRGTRTQYRFVGERMAANGVLTIVADYRTFPQAKFPDFMADAAKAVAWAMAHAGDYGGDRRQLFIAGHSAGAQIAALLATDPRYLARSGVDVRQIAGVIGLSGPYDFDITGQYRRIFDPPSQYPLAQAVNFVDGDEPPFLLIHGEKDTVVEVRDSIELADKLKSHGGKATLVLLPGAGHFAPAAALYRSKYAPEVLPAMLDFIRNQGPPTHADEP